jgi:hypothetical protein
VKSTRHVASISAPHFSQKSICASNISVRILGIT